MFCLFYLNKALLYEFKIIILLKLKYLMWIPIKDFIVFLLSTMLLFIQQIYLINVINILKNLQKH